MQTMNLGSHLLTEKPWVHKEDVILQIKLNQKQFI